MNRPIITLTTDFGQTDAYVAIMKGVILGIAAEAVLVDISHQIPHQDVRSAANLLADACDYFPPGSVHLAVVDPGVGTERRALAIENDAGRFVGPDNGLFFPALHRAGAVRTDGTMLAGRAVRLSEPRFWRHPLSRTFHGRDIFAPVAAHLATGVAIAQVGETVARIQALPERQLERTTAGALVGTVVRIDHFGNVISDIPATSVPARPVFEVSGRCIVGLSQSYQDAPLGALVGSSGFVEIAVRNGSAAAMLGVTVGDNVFVRSDG